MSDSALARIRAHLDAGERAEAGALLDTLLTGRHGSGDCRMLCDLHQLAAEYWRDDASQAAFHRTHAYIYALEGGFETDAAALHAALAAEGRV